MFHSPVGEEPTSIVESDPPASGSGDFGEKTFLKEKVNTAVGEASDAVGDLKCAAGGSGDATSTEQQSSVTEREDDNVAQGGNVAVMTDSDLWSEVGCHSPGEEATLFDRVSYLGVANINAPRSKVEIMRNMMVLNQETSADGEAVDVSIKIPHLCSGTVV